MNENQVSMALMKLEMKLALDRFKDYYKKISKQKKIPKGIVQFYTEAILSNNYKEVEKQYRLFFSYLQRSKNAKEKWKDEL